MEIIKTKDHLSIKLLAQRIKLYMEKEGCDPSPDTIIQWVRANLQNPFVNIWIAQEEDEVVGYCITNIQQLLDREVLNISHLDGDTEEIEKEILSVVEKWAKDFSIKYVGVFTKITDRWTGYGFEIKEHKMMKEI